MVGLNSYLVLAAFVFCCGLYTSLARRNAIAVLMGIELMLNAVNINLIAFWRFGPNILDLEGQIFAIFVIAIAAAEAAVGLAILILTYRNSRTTEVTYWDKLKW